MRMTLPVRMMTSSVKERFISNQLIGVRNCNKQTTIASGKVSVRRRRKSSLVETLHSASGPNDFFHQLGEFFEIWDCNDLAAVDFFCSSNWICFNLQGKAH